MIKNRKLYQEDIEQLEKDKKAELGEVYAILAPYVLFYKRHDVFDDKAKKRTSCYVYNTIDGTVRAKSPLMYGADKIFDWFDEQEDELLKGGFIDKDTPFITELDRYVLPSKPEEAKDLFKPEVSEGLKPIPLTKEKYKGEKVCLKKQKTQSKTT